jgi:hypothetical protein
MIDIVTFKWEQKGFRNKYTAEHVNRLAEMVKRNVTLPYRFVCVTDNPAGIRDDVTIVPLWENPAPQYGTEKRPNCFARLKMFSEEAKTQFSERIMWLDLDAPIVGNIDHIVRERADFKIWYVDKEVSPCNGSLVTHRLGTRTDIWTKFNPKNIHPEEGYQNSTGHIGSDQAWIAQNLTPKDVFYGQVDGVYSYRCHIKGKPLPPEAKIVFFHGDDKAEDLLEVGWIRRTLRALEVASDAPVAKGRSVPREKLRVVTWLWGSPKGSKVSFGADQVNTLLSMVDRHYRKPYEMVLISDDARGIDGAIRTIKLPNEFPQLEHPQQAGLGTCYRRLQMFKPEMADIISPRFVSMDLDCVIVGDVTPLWDRKEDAVFWDSGFFWAPYNGSMTLMTAGARRQVYEKFDPARTPKLAADKGLVGTDQAAVAHILGIGQATWNDERDGVWAFRNLGYTGDRERETRRQEKENRRRERRREDAEREARKDARQVAKKALPSNCRIVFFPGALKPHDPEVFRSFHWVRKNYRDQGVADG